MAAQRDGTSNLEETIRRCVRDEIRLFRNSSPPTPGNILNRTRSLIQEAASSASRELTGSGMSTGTSCSGASGGTGVKRPFPRSVTGHTFRPQKKKNCTAKAAVPIPKSVYLIDCPESQEDENDDGGCNDSLTLQPHEIIIKGEFDLIPGHSEEDVRKELVQVFKTKLPYIGEKDFDFVKREKNVITIPVVKAGHKWDFAHIKSLCGQGRVYVRLNVPEDEVNERANNDDDNDDEEQFSKSVFDSKRSDRGATSVFSQNQSQAMQPKLNSQVSINISSPSTSSDYASADAKISLLNTLFPNAKQSDIDLAVVLYDDIDSAADYLSEKQATQQKPKNTVTHAQVLLDDLDRIDAAADSLTDGQAPQYKYNNTRDESITANFSAADILQKLKQKMKPYHTAEKIKVDREDLVMDTFQHYKDANFDASTPVKFQVRGEPAVDTGGVLRQVYEDVFLTLVKGEQGFLLFQGPPERVIPVYRSSHILSGIFEMLGTIIAHSLIQGGPGFPYLSPVLYRYIATGDLQQGLASASCIDIMDSTLAKYVLQIRDGTPIELAILRNEEQFLDITCMHNSGETRLLNEHNRLDIVQALVMHDVLIKHKTALDQMRKGLSTLGLLAQIERFPEKFEHLFVYRDNEITKEFLKSLLRLPDQDPRAKEVVEMLLAFIDNATQEVLGKFLCFVTGSRSSTAALKPGCIRVTVEDTPSIYASTCILQLKLPLHFIDLAQFEASLCAVIDSTTFTTV